MKPYKILLSAYACEPYKGSEPGVGWNFVKQISKYHDLWIITRANNRKVIEKELQKNPLPNVTFIYFDLPRWLRFYKRGNRGIHLYYYLWQWGAHRKVAQLHQQVDFDLLHHLTFVNYWLPTFLPLLKMPFVWGPVGGGDTTPNAFLFTYSWRGKLYELTRRLTRFIFEKDFFVRLAAKNADVAIAVTNETAKRIKMLGAKKVVKLSQVGVSKEEMDKLCSNKQIDRKMEICRFVSIGTFIHWKGFHLSLQSFAKLQQTNDRIEYVLIGDGPEHGRLKKLAKKLGLGGKVKFLGKMSREAVLNQLQLCDVLLHPSLHDSGAFVCSEAMATGLPVICLDLGGPALQVTEETGFKIPALTPEQVIADMAKAMQTLAENPELRRKMGEAGRIRVQEHFSWDKKGEFIHKIYQQVLMQKNHK